MGQAWKVGVINQVEANSVIYREGEELNSIALILKGNAICSNAGISVVLGPGEFIALNDLYIGTYMCTTVSTTACAFYVFEAKGLEDLPSIVGFKKEYRGYLFKSLNRWLVRMYESYNLVVAASNDSMKKAKEIMGTYREIVQSYGGETERVQLLEGLDEFQKPLPVKEEWANMLKELQQIPVEVMAKYYSYLPKTTMYEMQEKIKLCTIFMNGIKAVVSHAGKVATSIISDRNDCVFKVICRTMASLAPSHANYKEVLSLLDQVVELVDQFENVLEKQCGQTTLFQRSQMEALYGSALVGEAIETSTNDGEESEEEIVGVLHNSLEQILFYGEIEEEVRENYTALMQQFIGLRNKNTTDESVRELRHSLSKLFFGIYKQVFKKAYKTGEYGKAVELFLHFGFQDERLLSKEQLVSLYRLKIKNTMTHYCNCYTMYDWLVEIYEGRKEPSKNDMDMDYYDHIREVAGKGNLTPQEEQAYMKDYEAKVDFELDNMFIHNMKHTNGKVSTYVPFVHKDNMPLNIEKFYVTPTKVDEALRDIIAVDFAAFYREVIYSNPECGVPREIVQIECVPDVLLFPTCGSNGVMWQELANKRRNTAARFCLPILCETNLADQMIRLVGRFRWELCRRLQGMAWNDIKNKCLTSEYNDYIQFYRKNRELSEEKKEKVRQQIQKARSNMRECFVIDYEQWIKFEASGAMRLNKCARDILATYCPFSKEIREKLIDRAQYAEGFQKYNKEAALKARVLDAKILAIRKNGYEVPKELLQTSAYYHNK